VDDELAELVSSALQIVQSSSPNYLLLASLDAARWQVGSPRGQGRAMLSAAAALAERARRSIRQSDAFGVLEQPAEGSEAHSSGAFAGLDPLRLTVFSQGGRRSGFELDDALIGDFGVYAELPSSRTLTFALGPGSAPEDVDRLLEALEEVAGTMGESDGGEEQGEDSPATEAFPSLALGALGVGTGAASTPREAYMSATEVVPMEGDAVCGRVSAEVVCPYPPGIPVLLPGEVITRECVAYLRHVLEQGGSVTGCSDPSLRSLRVLA
jgi:arginine decarboxylase